MKNLTIGILVFLSAVFSQAQFEMGKDDLCFLNKDPDLAMFGLWGELGAREGVCQGIAGISKVFKENVQFRPNLPKNPDTYNLIVDAVNSYLARPQRPIVITGFANLNQLCQAYRYTFLQFSIELNRNIAIYDIAPLYPQFSWLKDKAIWSQEQRQQLHNTVERQRSLLAKGSHPMILVYSHVMLVTQIEKQHYGVLYTYYDSNFHEFRQWFVGYDADGWPSLGQSMIWDITLN